MDAFWILLIVANAFTMVGILSGKWEAYIGSFLFLGAAVITLALGGAA